MTFGPRPANVAGIRPMPGRGGLNPVGVALNIFELMHIPFAFIEPDEPMSKYK